MAQPNWCRRINSYYEKVDYIKSMMYIGRELLTAPIGRDVYTKQKEVY